MNRRIAFSALALTLVACDGSRTEPATTERSANVRQPIVGGTPSTAADDAVVMLRDSEGGFCTGTLIAPNLLLTARHCISHELPGTPCSTFAPPFDPTTFTVATGVQPGAALANGKQIFIPQTNSMCGFDIALVLLDKAVPGAVVAKVRLTTPAQGEHARTVGYGEDGAGNLTAGRFVRSDLAVDGVGPGTFRWRDDVGRVSDVVTTNGEIVTGESTCFGDSGGPLFDAQGAVIGVTSRGIDQECIARPTIYTGVAAHAALVQTAATAAGHPLDGTATTPTTPANPTNPTNPTPGQDGKKGDEGEADDDTKGAPRLPSSSGAAAESSGCSAARGPVGGAGTASLLVGVGVAVLAGARRRRRTAP